jgi:4-hydroxy-tetrahydrodipicolinate reductase
MKVGITGCAGRMGSLLVQELRSGAWDDKGLVFVGGTIENTEEQTFDFDVTSHADELFEKADLVIDFTGPAATRQHIWLAAKHKTALVIGTTGLTEKDEMEIADAAKETSIVYAANMSVGVNLLCALVEQAAARLGPEWDIEIFETHHKHKVDAPSGTALALGKSAAKGRGVDLKDTGVYERYGQTGARNVGDIGFSVARGGDVAGEHTTFFYGEGERLELSHRATNRSIFARGALHAASWLKGKPSGLYSMRDVLDI